MASTVPRAPTTITIVAVAAKQAAALDQWMTTVLVENYCHIDTRTFMPKDPNATVKHGENGTFTGTQKAIFSQTTWPALMQHILTEAWSNPRVSLLCNQGMHRSDVSGRVAASLLNSLHDAGGSRLFNAQFFSLSGLSPRQVETTIADITMWASGPWCLMDSPSVVFGEEAANQSRVGSSHFAMVKGIVGSWVDGSHVQAAREASETSTETDSSGREEARGTKRQWEGEPDDSHRGWSSSWWGGDHSSHGDVQSSEYGAGVGSCRGSGDGHGVAAVAEEEPWVSFTADATQWSQFLRSAGVDDGARATLFLLAQLHEQGWHAANAIIAKLSKKKADGEVLQNPSGFVHRCAQNARAKVEHGWGA